MYRVCVQPDNQGLSFEEDTEVDIDMDPDTKAKITENEPNIQSHQIVKETDDMIEINLSNSAEELSTKIKSNKKSLNLDFERAAINSNEQLLAATSAMANGASIIYMTQVNDC